MFGLPGGSSGGGPVGSFGFWLAIAFTALVVSGLVGFIFWVMEQI